MGEPELVGAVVARMLPVLRCSALPLAFRCPGSVRQSEVPLNESHGAADVGTAAHEALRTLAETGSLDWDSIPAIALRHNADLSEVRMLCAMAAKLWPSIAHHFKGALSEVDLSFEIANDVLLTGHVDLLAIRGTVARAGDWKTGRKDSDYAQQMRGYAALILLENPFLTEVTVTVIWVRDGDIENYTMTRADAPSWALDLVNTVIHWDGTFRPGSACSHCPRSHECPAANALVRRDVAALSDRNLVGRAECEIELMSPEEIVELLRKADLVSDYAGRVRDAIKAHVQRHGDIVADGVRLTIDVEHQRKVSPLPAWPVLEAAGFNDEDFAACMDLRVSKVEKRVAEKAGRGKGAAAVRQLSADLEAAGAISLKEIQKLTQKRA